jgi:hypothetical protein
MSVAFKSWSKPAPTIEKSENYFQSQLTEQTMQELHSFDAGGDPDIKK